MLNKSDLNRFKIVKTNRLIVANFCAGATFEMKTVLYGIRLLIDNMMMHDKVYIWKQMAWGESKIAETEKERGREAERR